MEVRDLRFRRAMGARLVRAFIHALLVYRRRRPDTSRRGRTSTSLSALRHAAGVPLGAKEHALCWAHVRRKFTPAALLKVSAAHARARIIGLACVGRSVVRGVGAFRIADMFPSHGDAPGLDFKDLTRPPNSKRILSAWEEGHAPAINIYTVKQMNGEALEAFYRAELPKQGWELTTPASTGKKSQPRGMLLMLDGVTVVVATATDRYGHGTASITPSASGAMLIH